MISQIRSYFREQILLVDPELVENQSAFYLGDIGENLIDRSFQIEINDIVLTSRDSHYESALEVNVSIFGFGYKEEIKNYDELLDKALCIRDNIISLRNFTGKFEISNITAGSVVSEQLEGDDNGFKINSNYTLSIAYFREE
jgi:hypothetical protein